jgi:predicted nucleic-acid-binding protein
MIQSQKFEQDSISPIHSNANLLNNNIKEIDNYKQTINVSKEISPIITKDNSINIKNKPIVKKNEDDSKKIFYSIQIDKHVPISISGFGKYLIEHIEREEKYKLLYNNELKSFQSKIEKIFENTKGKDHYLTDYMIELWNKLQTSYFTRYEIMKQIINLHPSNLYNFLDRETEYLINYYKISEKIFSDIQKRENLKLKLQIQANRNDIKVNDHKKFNEITILLENSISEFKKKFTNVDIIWKGLRYQWFMNYENWFYEMENLSKNN